VDIFLETTEGGAICFKVAASFGAAAANIDVRLFNAALASQHQPPIQQPEKPERVQVGIRRAEVQVIDALLIENLALLIEASGRFT
jgi:hypothetical protein